MLLPIHIFIALASVLTATFSFVRPSKTSIHISSALVAATLLTGTYLVISMRAPLVQACITGIVYLAAVAFGIAGAYYRLSRLSK
ncbi:MAG TPA: hypothetical protein VJP80_02040 [Candidatus Saccharimonadales bacterium]|nr:hypothetical protein [Candidatus Saccharimonadales bacterium]